MNDKVSFEKFLLESIKNNRIKTSSYENINFTKDQQNKLNETISKSINYNLITQKSLSIKKNKSFGAFILSVREKASLSAKKMANILNIDKDEYDNLEKGISKISSFPEDFIVKILILFQIKLNEFIEMLKKETIISTDNQLNIQAIARSPHNAGTDDREKNILQGIDAVKMALSHKKENDNLNLNQHKELIERVRIILIQKKEKELLI